METTTLREAHSQDLPILLPLLGKFKSSHMLSEDNWRQLFDPQWQGNRNTCGLILFSGKKPVGFIHSLFSERIINGKPYTFCNLGSWIVEPEFRAKSMSLFFLLMKLSGVTFTSTSANPRFAPILQGFGFKYLDEKIYFDVPLPAFSRRTRVTWSFSEIEKYLSGEAKRIFMDHRFLSCQHLLVQTPDGPCYMVFNKTRAKRLPFAYVDYISDLALFRKYHRNCLAKMCAAMRVAGLMIGSHSLKGQPLSGAIRSSRQMKIWYRSSDLEAGDVDTLYSEFQVVGLTPA